MEYTGKLNLTMLTDFYELTMANGYFQNGFTETIAYFDLFFRRIPDGGGFVIMAGVAQMVEYLENLSFSEDDLDALRGHGFSEAFLDYLRHFQFACDVWAVPEGTPVFPGEPIVTVRGPVIQAQFVETMLLLCINHQSLIATKANRIVRAAQGRGVMEFGSRRAQGFDGAVYGARAAFIGGCVGTACTICERDFGIPALGTMAHSWIQLFDSELEAFCAYAREYPDNCTLLVDTYDTLHSGLPHAIEAFRRELLPRGCRPKGVRIDSGDITYLSKRMRKMLDEAGFPDCSIVASNSLDEYIIRDMLIQGAKVDSFGVGERLITAASDPVFGGVYKLSAIETEDGVIPKIKLSENVSKITTPGAKTVWRLFDRDSGKAIADVVTLMDEVIDERAPYELFDPEFTWKRKTVQNFLARPLLRKIFEHGKCICHTPSVEKIRAYCAEHGRPGLDMELAADPDAVYERLVDIDVTGREPVVACPHLPSNVKPVSEVGDTPIQQVVIGSCTNGRISDMRDAAAVLRGRKVDKKVRCIVLPSTPTVWKQCLKEGLMEVFMDAGCIVGPCTCGPCLGGHTGILGDGERAVATTNRNFRGRMGSLEAEVYLASPCTAAASAVTGVITSPEKL